MTAPTRQRMISNHEASAWLRGAAARRVRQITAAVPDASAYGVIIAPLGRTGPPGSREDRTCDRCDTFVPAGATLHVFVFAPTPRIRLCGGLCSRCETREAGR